MSIFSGFRTTEVEWQEGARQIDDCDYLFAKSISEIEELTLGLVVVEAKAQNRAYSPADDSPLERIKAGAKPIERDPTCRVFELLFDQSRMGVLRGFERVLWCLSAKTREIRGQVIPKFDSSHLLEFTKRTTIASSFLSGTVGALPDCMSKSRG